MATSAHLVYENFVWRLESLTLTSTEGNVRSRLLSFDPGRLDGEQIPTSRNFSVTWKQSGPETGHSDRYDRVADHEFELEVYYDGALKHQTLQKLMMQDRHDITKELRDPGKYDGYNASNSSTSTGLKNRFRKDDESESLDGVVVLRQTWRCTIFETEG